MRQIARTDSGMQQRRLPGREQADLQAGICDPRPLAEKAAHGGQALARAWHSRETERLIDRNARFFHCAELLEHVGPDIELQR